MYVCTDHVLDEVSKLRGIEIYDNIYLAVNDGTTHTDFNKVSKLRGDIYDGTAHSCRLHIKRVYNIPMQ